MKKTSKIWKWDNKDQYVIIFFKIVTRVKQLYYGGDKDAAIRFV